jgi:hypothetical protein
MLRTMPASRSWSVVAAGALAAAAPAQFVNRAAFLGVENESVRRDFRQGTEYFLDRFSYVVTPPWWDPDLRRFHDHVAYRVGSTSATQFTIEGQLDLAKELGDGVSFRYHFLQGENRDTRFVRNAIGLEYATSEHTALFAQAEPFADKSLIDLSLGGWLWREQDQGLRLMVTAVDWVNEKSREAEYVRDPYAVMASGVFGARDGHRIAFDVGAQLPFEVRSLDGGDDFELWRVIGDVEARLRVDERDRLVAAVEGERTGKHLTPVAAGDARAEDFDREFWQVRMEWWRDVELPWSAGFVHTRHDERGRRPNDPAADLRTHRREWLAVGRLHVPAGEKLSFEPQVFAGYVLDEYRDEAEVRDEERFEGKLNAVGRWDFAPGVSLALIVGFQLDELAFGGGGAQFVAVF